MAQSGQKVHSNRQYVLIRDHDTDQVADVINGRLAVGTNGVPFATVALTKVTLNTSTYTQLLAANTSRISYSRTNHGSFEARWKESEPAVPDQDAELGKPLGGSGGFYETPDARIYTGIVSAISVGGVTNVTISEENA